MERLQYLRIQSNLSVNQIELALHSLMSVKETPKLRYLALREDNYRIHYETGVNCQMVHIKLMKSSHPVPGSYEQPFKDLLYPGTSFSG